MAVSQLLSLSAPSLSLRLELHDGASEQLECTKQPDSAWRGGPARLKLQKFLL